jgi:hypothetical protein
MLGITLLVSWKEFIERKAQIKRNICSKKKNMKSNQINFTLIIAGGIISASLGLLSHILKISVIDFSSFNMLGFAGLLFIIIPVYFLLFGTVLSLIIVNLKSRKSSILASLLFGFVGSINSLKSTLSMYFGYESFIKAYFLGDIFDICANLLIFLLLGFLIWTFKERFDQDYQSR